MDIAIVELCLSAFMMFLCVTGFICNGLIVVVCCSQSMRAISINILIGSLAMADCVLLCLASVVFAPLPVSNEMPDWLTHLSVRLYPFAYMAQTASVWLLMLIAIERWFAICRPLLVKLVFTRCRALLWSVAVFLVSIGYNLSRFWEYDLVQVFGLDHDTNTTISKWRLVYQLRANEHYSFWFVNVCTIVTQYLLPITVLAVTSVLVARAMQRARIARATLNVRVQREHQAARMMLADIAAFILCYAASMVLNLLEILEIQIPTTFSDLTNTLIIINSSCSLFFYVRFSTRFRRQLRRTVTSNPFCERLLPNIVVQSSEGNTQLNRSHNGLSNYQLHMPPSNSTTPFTNNGLLSPAKRTYSESRNLHVRIVGSKLSVDKNGQVSSTALLGAPGDCANRERTFALRSCTSSSHIGEDKKTESTNLGLENEKNSLKMEISEC